MAFDYLPRELLERVLNIEDFPRVLVLDKWTCNSDGRQACFAAKHSEAGDTPQPSLTRGIASMLASGVSRTVRSEVYTRTIVFTRVSWDGRRLSRRSAGPRGWMFAPFGGALPNFGRVVRRRSRRPAPTGGGTAPSPDRHSEANQRVSRIDTESVSKLGRLADIG